MKYVYRETELSKKYQNIYLNARKDGNEILCYIGIDKRYRIYTKDSYYENISDMDALLELCIYPIYINGKRQTMRQSLKSTPPIIGDVASCIRPEDYLTMA